MFDALTALGYGIVIFALTVGVGVMVLAKFSSSAASCPTDHATYNSTNELCQNSSTPPGTTNPSTATVNINYMTTQLGSTGLAGWTPAIVAMAVGMLFLGAFLIKRGRTGRY